MDLLPHLVALFSNDASESDHKHVIIDHLRSNVPVTAPKADIVTAARALVNVVPEEGWSTNTVLAHLLQDIASGLARGASGPRFFGFVTGGALPAAQCADILTTIFDQNISIQRMRQFVPPLNTRRSCSSSTSSTFPARHSL